jgi:hypothetical protein
MHNTIRLNRYLDVVNTILTAEKAAVVNAEFTNEQHNGMTIYNNTIEANLCLSQALSVFQKSCIYGKTAMTEDQINQLLIKAFRSLTLCYITVFTGEAIDMEVIEARLKWGEALGERGEAEAEENELLLDTEWFVESLEHVVELLQQICVNTFSRDTLVSTMISVSNLIRQRGSVMNEMCYDDVEYLQKIMPHSFC